MAQTNAGYPDSTLRSTSGYVFNGKCTLLGVTFCAGSTAGLWQFKNGSTTGAVLFEAAMVASTPSKRDSKTVALPTLVFGSKCYVTKTGGNKGTATVSYLS